MIQAVLDGRHSRLDSVKANKNKLKRIQVEFTRQADLVTTYTRALGVVPQKAQELDRIIA